MTLILQSTIDVIIFGNYIYVYIYYYEQEDSGTRLSFWCNLVARAVPSAFKISKTSSLLLFFISNICTLHAKTKPSNSMCFSNCAYLYKTRTQKKVMYAKLLLQVRRFIHSFFLLYEYTKILGSYTIYSSCNVL